MNIDKTNKTEHSFDFFIQWHLTEKCNLMCTHCYQEGRAVGEMTLQEIKKTIRTVSDTIEQWSNTYGIPFSTSFNVTGGEPVLRYDFVRILQEISKYNFKIYILTNGTLIDTEKARRLAEIPVRGVQVSLEGPEAVHEAIRGKGSFSSALIGVECLLDAGIPITLNVTLSEINIDYFRDMTILATDLGVQHLGFSRLVPYGRGLNLLSSMLKKEKIKETYEEIFSVSTAGLDPERTIQTPLIKQGKAARSDQEYRADKAGSPPGGWGRELQIVTGDPVAAQLNADIADDDTEAFPMGGCAAGVSGVTLLPDGTITPCRRLGIPIGNILKDSLREVWAGSNVLTALRNKEAYKGKCRTCRRWSNCRGCRAIAYAYALSQGRDDFLEEDPQCFIE